MMGGKYFPASLGLIAIIVLTIAAPAIGQNTPPPSGGKNPPPNAQKNPPGSAGAPVPSTPGLCPRTVTIGPYFASDQAELAAQSARYQGNVASSVYETGWPDSYFNPIRYYFDVYVFAPCN
jgi:hypothetical protein